jgi:micrococcal nuclease
VVTKVIDGDTIHVLINGTDYKVRYIGMNAPEDTTKKEWLGPEATTRDGARRGQASDPCQRRL